MTHLSMKGNLAMGPTDYRQKRCPHGYVDQSQCEICQEIGIIHAANDALRSRVSELEAVLRLYRDALERIIAPENDHRAATCRAIANEALKD